jgi:hypothetical protein
MEKSMEQDKTKVSDRIDDSHPEHHHHPEEVTVTVDSKPHKVPKGTYLVSVFKELVGVPASKELDEVIHGELKPLDDNKEIHIKNGEVFISHARQGGSS